MTKKKNSQDRSKGRAQSRSSSSRGRSSSKGSQSRSSSKRGRPKSPQPFRLNFPQKALLIGIVLIFLTAVIILSLLSPNQGQLTAALADLLWRGFGWGGAIVPLILGAVGFYLVLWGMEQQPTLPTRRVAGLALLFVTLEALASLLVAMQDNGLHDVWAVAQEQRGGGYLGGLVAWSIKLVAGDLGTILILTIIGILATVLLTGVTLAELAALRQLVPQSRAEAPTGQPTTDGAPRERPSLRDTPAVSQPPLRLGGADQGGNREVEAADSEAAEGKTKRGRKRGKTAAPESAPAGDEASGAEPVPIFLGAGAGQQFWQLPQVEQLLDAGGDQETNDIAIREHVEIIEHTLASFGAPASVVEISQGPTITQYGVEPQFIEQRSGKRTKVKVGKIASLADDLALALAARSIRIQAPVPGKGYVGIEVPNPAKSLVSLRDVMESDAFQKVRGPLALGLGQNVAGQAICADLSNMPHLLIAGATGSGKSVCVNSIIACLLLQHTPEDLRFVMIDPKRVELVGYNGIPHLVAPVVVDLERVVGTLQWAMREMETRYQKLAALGVRNIGEYNRKAARRPEVDKMPYVIILIDELADLMMMAPEDTEKSITRLAQMSRATGIHMIIATQRPSVDVVTGLIKANFPARVAFAVASGTDSRVILDTTGAERLLGQGDMLFQSPDAAAAIRMQGCFVSDKELSQLISYWQAQRRQNLMRLRGPVGAQEDGAPPEERSAPAVADAADAAAAPARPSGNAKPAEMEPTTSKTAGTKAEAEPARPHPAPRASRRVEPMGEDQPDPTAASLPSPLQQPLWDELIPEDEGEQYEDELMPEAIALVRKLDKASTSLLQRRFRIGYTRAARLMDVMEEQGIIGPPTGTSKAREVLPWQPSQGVAPETALETEDEATDAVAD